MNKPTYTETEFRQALSKLMEHYEDAPRKIEKKAFLICAQPGAGKTGLASYFTQKASALFLNADEYRKKFPGYKELYALYGDEFVSITSQFSGKMTEALIDRLSDKGYNLTIEGTLRTTEVPTRTCELLKQKDYTVELDILAVRPEISYLRTLKRYEEMKESGTTPRKTSKEHHDLVTSRLVQNLSTLYTEGVFDTIRILKIDNDQFKVIYDQSQTPDQDPGLVLKKEHDRKYTAKEIDQIKKDYGRYISKEDFSILFKGRKIQRKIEHEISR